MLGLYAVAFGSYFAALVGWTGRQLAARFRQRWSSSASPALNLAGSRMVAGGEALLVYFKLAVLVVFCLGGLFSVARRRVSPAGFPSAGTIVYAGALIFLGYEGFELIANAAEDARDPERTLPRAFAVAIGAVIVLYVLVAFVAVGNLTPAEISDQRDYALAAAARPFFGRGRVHDDRGRRGVSTASAINATMYGAAKFTYLMARHGELPGRLPGRSGTARSAGCSPPRSARW